MTERSHTDPFDRTVRHARVRVGFGLDTSGSGGEQWIVADRDLDRGQEPTGKRGPVNIGYRLPWEGQPGYVVILPPRLLSANPWYGRYEGSVRLRPLDLKTTAISVGYPGMCTPNTRTFPLY